MDAVGLIRQLVRALNDNSCKLWFSVETDFSRQKLRKNILETIGNGGPERREVPGKRRDSNALDRCVTWGNSAIWQSGGAPKNRKAGYRFKSCLPHRYPPAGEEA